MLEAKADWVLDTPLGALLFNGTQVGYLTALAAAAPSSYFKMDETAGTVMTNAAGGSNGTYVGGMAFGAFAPWSGGGRNISPVGPGSGDYSTIPGALLTAQVNWHMSIWGASFDVTSNAKTYLIDGSTASHPDLYIASGGIPTLVIVDAGETTTLTGPAVAINAWHQYGISGDGYRIKLWMDGVVVAQSVRTNSYTPPSSGTIYVGVDSALTASTFWAGYLSALAIWNSFLSPQQITRMYSVAMDAQGGTLRMNDAPTRDVGMRVEVDSFPLADGGTVGDEYADPATWSFTGHLQATTDAVLQTTAQRFRGRINSLLRGAGTLYWTPDGFVPLQAVVRRGERPETGKGSQSYKPTLMQLLSADPRVYSQALVTTPVTVVAQGGFTSPFTSPVEEVVQAPTDASIVNSGDAFTPPLIELTGPYTYCTLLATYVYDGVTYTKALVLDTSLNNGVSITIDVATGRVYSGTSWSAANNRRGNIAPGSVLWEIAPAATTTVRCTMVGSASGSSCKLSHRHAWMP